MTPARRNGYHIVLIAEALADIERRLAGKPPTILAEDRDELALTALRLSIIGENANKLSPELKGRHPHIPWHQIYAFSSVVANAYSLVVPSHVWEAAQSLDPIKAMCRQELNRLSALDRSNDHEGRSR